jgi:hypothetical protein
MILRRLAQNLREQNWTTITIEFVLLVVGVFLGIQAANWNEARHEQAMEAEYLVRLDRDFQAIDTRLQGNVSRWEHTARAAARVLADLDAYQRKGAWPRPKAEILLDLEDMHESRIPAPRAAAYVELLATGQLGLVRDTRLRDALLDYYTQVGFTQTAFDLLARRVDPHRAVVAAHLEFNPESLGTDVTTAVAQGVNSWTDVDLDQLAIDPDLKSTLNLLANASSNQWLVARLQQQKARDVLALLGSGDAPAGDQQP